MSQTVPESLLTTESLQGLFDLTHHKIANVSEAPPDTQVLYDLAVQDGCWVDRPESKTLDYYMESYVYGWYCYFVFGMYGQNESAVRVADPKSIWNALCLLEPILPKCSQY